MRRYLLLALTLVSLHVFLVCALVVTPWFWLPFAGTLLTLEIRGLTERCPECGAPMGRAPNPCVRCAPLDPTTSFGA